MVELEEWLKSEQSEGTLNSSGQFTVDLLKARIKLSSHLLEEGLYLAKFVQAGVAAGTRKIEVRLDGNLAIRFEGSTSASVSEIARGLEEPQSLPADSASACLVIGLLAARGASNRAVTCSCGDGSVIDLTPEGEVKFAREATTVSSTTWASIFVQYVGDCALERKILKERCAYSPIPITLDGEPLSPGWREEFNEKLSPEYRLIEQYWGGTELHFGLPEKDRNRACFELRESAEPWGCAVAISAELKGLAKVRFLRHGVIVASEELPGVCPGTVVAISAQSCRTDLSQFNITRDEVYHALLAEAKKQAISTFVYLRKHQDELTLPYPPGAQLEGAMRMFGGTAAAATAFAFFNPHLAPFIVLGASVGTLVTSTGYYFVKGLSSDRGRARQIRKKLSAIKVAG